MSTFYACVAQKKGFRYVTKWKDWYERNFLKCP